MKKTIACWILAICTVGSNAHAQMGFPYMYQQHADQQALGPLPDVEFDQYVSNIINQANDCMEKAMRLNELATTAAHRVEILGRIENLNNNMNNCTMAQMTMREFAQILKLRGVPSQAPQQ